jgi:hypothetical protein
MILGTPIAGEVSLAADMPVNCPVPAQKWTKPVAAEAETGFSL